MFRKMLGVLTALATTLAVVGVAWASSDGAEAATGADRSSTTITVDDRSTSTVDGSTSTSSDRGSSTSTSVDRGSTTTTVRGGGSTSTSVTTPSTTIPGSTSTTNPGSTSTTTPGSTSTTIDDDDPVPDGDYSYAVASAGTVVIRVTGGNLSLLSVTANAGWSYEVEKNRFDVVEVEFNKGDSEASIKVEPDDGELKVEIEFKTG